MAQELKDWEENPHLYLQDNEGNFVLKKDGTPRKKSGRPALKDEAKFAAHRAISRKQKNIKKIEQKLITKWCTDYFFESLYLSLIVVLIILFNFCLIFFMPRFIHIFQITLFQLTLLVDQ